MKILEDALANLNEEKASLLAKHEKLLKEIEEAQARKAQAQADLDRLIEVRDALGVQEELIRINNSISRVARANGGRFLNDGRGGEAINPAAIQPSE